MDIQQSVKTVLANYANFNGRSSRAEFWWWLLAYFLAAVVLAFIGGVLNLNFLPSLLALALLVPNIAVSVRRFHDIGMTGWWALIFIIPLVGLIAMIYFFIKPSVGPNEYGEGPLAPVS